MVSLRDRFFRAQFAPPRNYAAKRLGIVGLLACALGGLRLCACFPAFPDKLQ